MGPVPEEHVQLKNEPQDRNSQRQEVEFEKWYRVFIVLALALLFTLQKTIEARTTGATKLLGGYLATAGFLLTTAEVSTLGLLRTVRSIRSRLGPLRTFDATVLGTATVLFVAGIFSNRLVGYVGAVDVATGPTLTLLALAAWGIFVAHSLREGLTERSAFFGLSALVVALRLIAYESLPFDRIPGDMLSTLDRALGDMFSGRSPYGVSPMPYFPLTLLSYAPPKLMGGDLRWANPVIEVATIAVALFAWRGAASGGTGSQWSGARTGHLEVSRLVLPVLLLLPPWTFYSAVSQIPVSVLAAVLLVRSLSARDNVWQAIALGATVATNPTFGVLGFVLGGYWLGRFGAVKGAKLAGVALFTCALIVTPFILSNPKGFIDVAFISQVPFRDSQFPGRFTLLPAATILVPVHTTSVFIGCTFILGAWLGYRAKTAGAVAGAMAVAYCLALMFLHRTFSHYFLPVIALATSAEVEWEPAPARGTEPAATPAEGMAGQPSQRAEEEANDGA